MIDQESPPSTQTRMAEGPRKQRDSERRRSRAVGAAVVASGLAFSVSLYPVPDGPQLSDLLTPGHQSSAESPNAQKLRFLSLKSVEAATLNLPDLVKLAALVSDLPGVATSGLLDLVQTYGLADVVHALEFLWSFSPLPQAFPATSAVNGRGGDASAIIPASASLAMISLLDYLRQHPPLFWRLDLLEVITTILPILAQSLGISNTPTPEDDFVLAAAPEAATIAGLPPAPPTSAPSGIREAPVLTPELAVAPSAEFNDAPIPEGTLTPIAEVTVSPTSELPASTPTETDIQTLTDAPDSSPPVPSASAEDLANSPASKSDSMNADPSSAPSDSPDGESTGGNSPGDSGGESAGASGGVSAGDPGGGSAGGE